MLVKKRYLWLKIKIAVLLTAILAGGIYIVFYSSVFKITGVNVAIADFDASKSADLIGEDPRGQNLIFWSPSPTAQYPEIKDLKITKDYMNRTIEISGSVRDKKMVWCFLGLRSSLSEVGRVKGCFWVDETGYIFTEAPNVEGGALTVINDNRSVPLEVSDVVLPSAMFKNLNTILNILSELKLPIADINIQDLKLREFVVYIQNGPKLTFSLEGNPNFVRPALSSLIKSPTWNKTKTVNLTVEGRVYQGF